MSQLVLFLLQVTVFAALIAVIYAVGKQRWGSWARFLLLSGLVGLLAMPCIMLFPKTGIWQIPVEHSIAASTDRSAIVEQGNRHAVESGLLSYGLFNELTPVLMIAVLVFILFQVLRLAGDIYSLHRLVQRSELITEEWLHRVLRSLTEQHPAGVARELPTRIRVFQSPELHVPATIGWGVSAIVLPRNWRELTPSQLTAVLAHELEHIVQRDFAWRFLAELVRSIYFYHPLVGWLVKQFRLEQEYHADSVAAKLTDLGQYENALFDIAQSNRVRGKRVLFAPSFSTMQKKSMLRRRIEMLRRRISQPQRVRLRHRLITGLVVIPIIVMTCGARISSESTKQLERGHGEPERTGELSVHSLQDAGKNGVVERTRSPRTVEFEFHRWLELGPSDSSPGPKELESPGGLIQGGLYFQQNLIFTDLP